MGSDKVHAGRCGGRAIMGPHFAFFAPTIALLLALGPLAFIGDGAEEFPDVPREIVNDAIASILMCKENPIQRLYTLRSRLVHLAYTEIPVEEREPFVFPSPLPALLSVPPTYTIDDAILKHYSFFAIPLGYSRMTNQQFNCDADIELNTL